MATLDQLETALRNADAAGDTQAARALAAEVVRMRGSQATTVSAPGYGLTDALKSVGVGLARGAIGLAGLPGDLSNVIGQGLSFLEQKVTGETDAERAERDLAATKAKAAVPNITPTSRDITSAVESQTGEFYKPQTRAGRYAETIGEFAPAALVGPGRLGTKLVTQALLPGVGSEAAGELTKGTGYEPYARVAGALAGGLAPSAVRRMITPLPADAQRTAAVQTLRNEGVTDITAGQATGRKPLQYLEAERGRGSGLMDSQAEQFTAAALRRAGVDANRATPEVIDHAYARIGRQFDDLAERNTARLDPQFANDLTTAVDEYRSLVSAPNRAPAIDNFVQEIANAINRHGNLPGDVYQSLRSRMETAARRLRNQPEAMMAIREMRAALDDVMERSIQANNPADLGAWQQARREYANMLVLEKASTGAGEGAAIGLISPAKLREASVSTQGRRAYARGRGDFADLARSGVAVMSPLPNSGTPGRIAAQNLGASISSLLGGGAGFAASGGNPVVAALGAVAGAAAPRLIGRAATSGAGRAYLGNQFMTGRPALSASRRALLEALMASARPRLEAPH